MLQQNVLNQRRKDGINIRCVEIWGIFGMNFPKRNPITPRRNHLAPKENSK